MVGFELHDSAKWSRSPKARVLRRWPAHVLTSLPSSLHDAQSCRSYIFDTPKHAALLSS